jgi:outer membrane receptor protein involved in Fe transport
MARAGERWSAAPQSIVRLLAAAWIGALPWACAQAAEAGAALAPVTVIGSTPLPGLGQPLEELASPVQSAISRDIRASGASDLGDFMNRRFGSVHVNEMQGNPYQLDVNYRGYTASPLLGTPQGLSVYMDGVRMNQPFGDVVSWDLIPRSAVASMTLMPGSNPLFGLNTLGGALSLQTKDGKTDPGTALTSTMGGHARRGLEFEHGGFNDKGLNWFVTSNQFRDRGWRDDSPSDLRQLFGKLGWSDARSDLKLTLAHADNQLSGNGLQEQGLLALDRASVYTKPDITQNRSTMLNLSASYAVHDNLLFSGNLHYRKIRSSSYNGDINEGSLDQSVYQPSPADQAALAAAGYRGFPTSGATAANTPFPFWRCLAQALQVSDPADPGEPGEKCNALINRTQTAQTNYGVSGQLTWLGDLGGKRNQFVLGGSYDGSSIRFSQTTELGYLRPDRSVAGINAFADGTTGGNIDGVPLDSRVNLSGRAHTWSVLASDTVWLNDRLALTVSGRHNKTSIVNQDQLHEAADRASLSGAHSFSRFNPALGLTYSPTRSLNTYAGYSQSSRTPTAIELGCANPDQPCKLPNAMAGDPPLRQVITRTLEAGVRGHAGAGTRWNVGVFSADNRDDILFVADDQAGFGYFKNFGVTRRRGLELGVSGKAGRFELGAQYTWLDATYQTAESVNGSSNSRNSSAAAVAPGLDGSISIRPGDRIPLIPRQMFKLFADAALSPAFTLHGSALAMSGALARGNENGAHQADGRTYFGPGRSAGYVTFNLGGGYRLAPQWQLAVQLSNLFDTRYNTAAQLGPNGFDAKGQFVARPLGQSAAGDYPLVHSTFYAPGAPRAISLQLRYSFEKPRA